MGGRWPGAPPGCPGRTGCDGKGRGPPSGGRGPVDVGRAVWPGRMDPGIAGRVGAGGDTVGRMTGRCGAGLAAGASPVTGSSIRSRRTGGTMRPVGRSTAGAAGAGAGGRAATGADGADAGGAGAAAGAAGAAAAGATGAGVGSITAGAGGSATAAGSATGVGAGVGAGVGSTGAGSATAGASAIAGAGAGSGSATTSAAGAGCSASTDGAGADSRWSGASAWSCVACAVSASAAWPPSAAGLTVLTRRGRKTAAGLGGSGALAAPLAGAFLVVVGASANITDGGGS